MDIPDHHVPQLTHLNVECKLLENGIIIIIEWLSREILISNFNLGFELGFAWWL